MEIHIWLGDDLCKIGAINIYFNQNVYTRYEQLFEENQDSLADQKGKFLLIAIDFPIVFKFRASINLRLYCVKNYCKLFLQKKLTKSKFDESKR